MLRNYIDKLGELGILTHCDDAQTYALCGIQAPESMNDVYDVERFGRMVLVGRYEGIDANIIDPFHIRMVDQRWEYFNRPAEIFGVENLAGISGSVQSLETVIDICRNYLLTPPVDVQGWPVPVCQQPRWELSQIVSAVKDAKAISEPKMIQLVIERRELAHSLIHSGQLDTAAEGQYYYYVICKNGREPRTAIREGILTPRLYLRYDLAQAFVVGE